VFTIRLAHPGDLEGITEIYNDAILHTTATFDSQPKTRAEQEVWFAQHEKFPLLVALEGDLVVGWASLSKWSDRCAYSDTAEASLYVRDGYRRRGIGKQLTEALLAAGKAGGLHTVVTRIVEGNEVSLRLCKSYGFEEVGVMREVGRKFDQWLDVHVLQLIFHD
jgi:L-amino acid N-acyltransferase